MGRIITGTKGFEFTVRGSIPPEIQDDEQAVVMWVLGNMSMSAIIAGFVKESSVRMVDISVTGVPGQPGPKLEK